MTGKARSGERDFRAISPRFQGANLDRNLALVEQLRVVADRIGAAVAQVAIAWVVAQGTDIVPLVGARRRERLTEALGALDLRLSSDDLAALARAMPTQAVAGDRYQPPNLPIWIAKRERSMCKANTHRR
jgi:pyridoxine 4-dehydrogenase